MLGKPLLLIDVDGPLNPYAAKPSKRPEGYLTYRKPFFDPARNKMHELRVWLNPDHGKMLNEFAVSNGLELAWCTTWNSEANSWIGPKIGLTENWPTIMFDPIELADTNIWKFNAVEKYAQGRDLIWLDDDFNSYPRARDSFKLRRMHSSNTMLHWVSPRLGITKQDLIDIKVKVVTSWKVYPQ